MTAPMDVILFRRTPPKIRPLMIIITALALGFICLGVVLTIIGNWPGYSPYGGNPLRIVGPILLAVGVIAFMAITVDCCVRTSKNKPIYEKDKKPPSVSAYRTIAIAEQQYQHPYAAKYEQKTEYKSEPSVMTKSAPPSSTKSSYNNPKSGPPSSTSQPSKPGAKTGGPPPAPPIPTGGIPVQRKSLIEEGYKPLDLQRHWGQVPVEMRQLPEERNPSVKAVHENIHQASLAALMGQGAGGQKPGTQGNTNQPITHQVQMRKPQANRPENLEFKAAPVIPVPQAVATGQVGQGQQPRWGQAAQATVTTTQQPPATIPADDSPGALDKEKSESKKSLPVLQIPMSYKSDMNKVSEKEKQEKQKKEQEVTQKVKSKEQQTKGAPNKGYVTDEDLWPTESTPKEDDGRNKAHHSNQTTPKSRKRELSQGHDKDKRDRERSREWSRERGRRSERGDNHKHGRSHSQDARGSRSRDSSRGRKSSFEDFNTINYVSGKPRPHKDNAGQHHRSKSHDRERSRDRRYTNRGFDPDESADSSAKRRERERERQRKRRDDDVFSETASSALVPFGRYHVPRRHNTSMSDAGTVIDEPINKPVNPKYTININAQPGSAVQIGFPKGGIPTFRMGKLNQDQLPVLDNMSTVSSSLA